MWADFVADTSAAPPRMYARFSRRFRALVVDSVVYAAALVSLIVLLEIGGGDRTHTRAIIIAWLAFVLLYEPVLVWRRGATLGHAYTNLRVVDLRSGGNPTFLRAFGRFWVKGLFGLLVFVFMGTTRRHQALHDLIFGTTVEIRDPSRATAFDYVTERGPDPLRVSVPAWRRLLVILVYQLVLFIVFALSLLAAESGDCFNRNVCSPTEKLLESSLALTWLGALALVISLGWRGRLAGARARPQPGPIGSTPRAERTWPLFVVAACAFLPGLGVLFASIGLTWGLVSDRPRALLAAVLAGIGGVLNLVGAVLFYWQMQGDPAWAEVRAPRTKRDLAKLVVALEDYRAANGQYPRSLAVFTRVPLSLKFVNVTDLSAGAFPVPRLYTYRRSGNGRWYDVYGVGADGQPDTADDLRPELPDSLARRSGYRPSR
jgi:uncharacterized RDD family membrane protein YckC